MKIKPLFAWYDFWVGIFFDIKKRILYIFPFPTIGVSIHLEDKLPEGYYFKDSYSSKEYPYCLFHKHGQVGSFKTKKEALNYAIEQNKIINECLNS